MSATLPHNLPDSFLRKWQEIADLIAAVLNVPSALIMKAENGFMEVFISGRTEDNPYHTGDREPWEGLYCETVIKSRQSLTVPNALKDDRWDHNPDLKLGMIAYFGVPIHFPDQTPFGTLCVLDNKERDFAALHKKLIFQFKNVLELDLALITSLNLDNDNQNIVGKLQGNKEKLDLVTDELTEVSHELENIQTLAEETGRQFQMLVDNAPEAIFIQTDWKFAYVNQMGLKLFGASNMDQLMGKPVLDRFHPDFFEEIKQRIIGLNENREVQPLLEQIFYQLDMTPVPVEVSGIPVTYEGKNGALVFIRDITERKKNEKALHHSHDLMKYIIEHNRSAVAVHDKDMRYVFVSQKYLDDYQVKEKDIIGKHHYEVFPDLPQKWREVHRKALQGMVSSAEDDPYIKADGTVEWTRWECRPWYEADNSIGGLIVYTEVITKRKEAENRLRESEEKFKNLFENHSAVKMIIDPETLQIIDANPAAARFYGWPVDKLKTMKISDISTLNEDTIMTEINSMKKGESSYFEFRHRKADDSMVDVEVFSSIVEISGKEYIHSIIHDITEKKRMFRDIIEAKERAEESEKQFMAAFEANPVALSIISLDNSKIYAANEVCCQLYGFPIEQLINHTTNELRIWENAQNRKVALQEFAETGRISLFEAVARTASGEHKTILLSAEPITWKGEPCLLTSSIDITDRKLMENQLLLAKEKAEESNRLKSAFLQNMSHEVRTPLNAIVGFSQLLVQCCEAEETQKEYTELIAQSSDKLIEIITDVVEISELQASRLPVELSDFSLDFIFTPLMEKFGKTAADRHLGFSLELPPELEEKMIRTDLDKLKRIIFHLTDNAVKFTLNGNIQIDCSMVNNELKLVFRDNGIGISKEMQQLIFEPFRQAEVSTTRNFGGNGLGLSIALAYTRLLNGSLNIESEINKGTTVYLTIPVKMAENPTIMTPEPVLIKNTYNLLIAEDEDSNYLYLKSQLKKAPVSIIYARNGKEAVDHCTSNPAIDLVLMDIRMPLMDGITATKLIREKRPELPVIAQTAFALQSEIAQYSHLFNDYLTKPISGKALKSVLQKYISL